MTAKRLAGRIALITGASRGIGRAAAAAFAAEGAHVVLVARTKGGLEEADDEVKAAGGTATLVTLNLAHGDKLDALGPSLYERFKRLDILIANAAMLGPLSPLGHIKTEDWQRTLDINLTANFRLIRTLDPLLRLSEAGRAVFVSSGAARRCRAYWGPYSVTKAALEALVRTYASEIASTSVRANILDPGIVRTAMRAAAMPGEDPTTLVPPSAVAPVLVAMSLPEYTDNGALVEAPRHPLYHPA
jgi:NAD(P)-dependent dehydrogenase (short-subunit alcohol dehydrogenase family)